MDKQNQNECRCEKAPCGCAAVGVERCTCGERCECKRACRCSGGCGCTVAK